MHLNIAILLLFPPRNRKPNVLPQTQWCKVFSLVRSDLRSDPDQVGFLGLDKLGPLDELEANPQYDADKAHGVVRHEGADIEFVEGGVAVDGERDREDNDAGDGYVRLAPSAVRQVLAIVALNFESTIEEEVDGAHEDVVHKLRSLRDIGQPLKTL